MNSVNGPEGYQADLVKIINGDSLSRYADLFEMRAVEAPFAGSYDGVRQDLNLGSYVEVVQSAGLRPEYPRS